MLKVIICSFGSAWVFTRFLYSIPTSEKQADEEKEKQAVREYSLGGSSEILGIAHVPHQQPVERCEASLQAALALYVSF